tara:strand:+ start:572 stop:910 length:339 start_codon:yes stop_codon:yes gene_type:complete
VSYLAEHAKQLIERLHASEVRKMRAELRLMLSRRKNSRLWKLSRILDLIAYDFAESGDERALIGIEFVCDRCGEYADDCVEISEKTVCHNCLTGNELSAEGQFVPEPVSSSE